MVDPTDPGTTFDDQSVLKAVLHHLHARVRPEQLETWFRSLKVRRFDQAEIEFSVTSQFVRDWLNRNYVTVLQDAVAALGEPRRKVLLTQREEDGFDIFRLGSARSGAGATGAATDTANPLIADEIERVIRLQVGGQAERAPAVIQGAGGQGTVGDDGGPVNPGAGHWPRRATNPLNPNYTFDKFVVGSCNRLAHASSIAISENPGRAYNPLFVHGSVGLGKSHLLQAICHTILRRDPHARVVYLSCEDFTNAFIHAIQNQKLDVFRDFYRSADVLVIDDVQFFANREKTQDEFFHTFNTLYDAQKQIVLSSDRKPMEIPTIEERLVSRFKWGLVAEVEAPCLETRKAIVRRKAEGRGIDLPDEVVGLLAERVSTNIRELEGAVIKVMGIAAITERPIDLALAESTMRGMPLPHSKVSSDDVMALVTGEFAISSRELIGKGRTQTVSLPRQIAMFLLREHTDSSLEEVGRIFGNRDHTTVLYAVTKVRDRSKVDRMFKELLDGLSNRLLTRSFRTG